MCPRIDTAKNLNPRGMGEQVSIRMIVGRITREKRSFAELLNRMQANPVPEKGLFVKVNLSFSAQDDKRRDRVPLRMTGPAQDVTHKMRKS